MADIDLKSSASRIGCLYPILVDENGEIIDGAHRYKANKKWRKVKLSHVKTEKDRLIVRIVANNVRRSVPSEEKNKLLNNLGEVLLREGVEPGRISYIIAEETGMSYRWVAKYLASDYKNRLQSTKGKLAAQHAAEIIDGVTTPPRKGGTITVKSYVNTAFVTVTVQKNLYLEFQKASLELGIPAETSIMKALEHHIVR